MTVSIHIKDDSQNLPLSEQVNCQYLITVGNLAQKQTYTPPKVEVAANVGLERRRLQYINNESA